MGNDMAITNITSETTLLAAQMDKSFGFTGTCEITQACQKANASLFDSAKSVAHESGFGALVAGATSLAALGSMDATALFVGAAAGAIASVSKSPNSKETVKKGWTF